MVEGKKIYDLAIIGSGPAGYGTAVYSGRANLSTILFSGLQKGGQLMLTTEVENYLGFTSIQGPEIMKNMHEHALSCGVDIVEQNVIELKKHQNNFIIKASNKQEYIFKSVVIATGAQAKWLGLESEQNFLGFGVSGCATCDGFFFKNKSVAVVGGGNTAAEEALFLTRYCKKVYLVHRRDKLRCEDVLFQRILNNEKIEIIWNSQLNEVIGEDGDLGKFVTGVDLKNVHDNSLKRIQLDGVFIAIGHKPNTGIFKDILPMDKEGYIDVVAGTTKTKVKGVFAAGDVQDKRYKQAIVAAGFGCMAALDALEYIENEYE